MKDSKKDKNLKNERPLIFDDDLIDTCKAASATDCTGIIQTAPLKTGEYEAYKDVYDFTPPDIFDNLNEDVINGMKKDLEKPKKQSRVKNEDVIDGEKDISDVFDYDDVEDIF